MKDWRMRGAVFAAVIAVVGCGQSAQAPSPAVAAPSGAWDANLLALLPQIDSCIADANGPRMVSYAGAEGDGVTLVRLRGETALDCRVRDGVADTQPRDEALQVEGEDAAFFVRGPGENPGGECYAAPEVRDASGAVIGWMLDPEGC